MRHDLNDGIQAIVSGLVVMSIRVCAALVVTVRDKLAGLRVCALVPNVKGAERAIDAGADLLILPISASFAHSQANVRKTPDKMIDSVRAILEARNAAGAATRLEAGIGTAFGCAIQGDVRESDVLRLAEAALEAGADCISLADTVGYANPARVCTAPSTRPDCRKPMHPFILLTGAYTHERR